MSQIIKIWEKINYKRKTQSGQKWVKNVRQNQTTQKYIKGEN